MGKKKILFIVSDFYHNGAQREMYEIDAALDKEKIEVSILSLVGLNTRTDLPDYFYEKHISQESKVLFLDDFKLNFKKSISYRIVNKLSKNYLNRKERANNIKALENLFSSYDKVIFMGEYVYQAIAPLVTKFFFNEIFIFIMSSRFQNENYRNFSKTNNYVFFSGFDDSKQLSFEFEGFNNFRHYYLPLALAIDKKYKKWQFNNNKTVKKIGIFTRLHTDKPLDPFFYALQVLLQQGFNLELHVFGVGDYRLAGYDRYIKHLGLQSNVFFRGHQENMKQSINEEEIDLVWFLGYKNRPAGYSGFEVGLTGTPQLFWDFYEGKNDQLNNIDNVYPHYKDLMLFVEASKSVLFDEAAANELAKNQFEDVLLNRDIYKYINEIQEILLN